MKAAALGILGMVIAGCGSSGGAGEAGQLISVPCVNGHAVQSFPGESKYEIEATVWLVATLPANPPADFTANAKLQPIDSGSGVIAEITDGQLDVTCGMTFLGAGQAVPTASVELYERP